jgi:hypothetical protein
LLDPLELNIEISFLISGHESTCMKEDLSRKAAKSQSAAACLSLPLHLCGFA